jgi:membrane-bound serine protease (ClpP class)
VRYFALALVLMGAALAVGGGTDAAAQPAATAGPVVYEVSLTGAVDPLIARVAERGIRRAEAAGAPVLIRIDTPGGLDSSMRHIVKAVQTATVPVICWVGPSGSRAASAGTFVLLACPIAAMAPGTNVGAAHPVGLSGDVLSEKVTNDAAAYIRSIAEQRGRNVDWAETAVRDSASIGAEEALRLDVIDLLARDKPALFAAVSGRTVDTAAGPVTLAVDGATVKPVHMAWGESLLHALFDPNLAFLLFVLGIGGLVFEVLHPGISIPGIVGLVFLVSSLIIFGTLPVNIGGLVLLAAAFVFFAIDLHVPGHGIATVAGMVSLVLGGLYLYDGSVPNARVSRWLLAVITLAFAGFFFFVVRAVLKARHAPSTTGVLSLIGVEGEVTEPLQPMGRVLVRGESWRAMVREPPAEPIPIGARVRVAAVEGLTMEVEPLVGTESEAAGVRSGS